MALRTKYWYKDAIIYELHVRSFFDADANGIGDFVGLLEKLDYLESLGVTALWLLPFYPSPLKDDGYDIASYTEINPEYGTLSDVRQFIDEAHRRGLQVITELVLNHTSDQHPWFQRARRAPRESPERDFYVWSDTPDKFQKARIIFADTKTSNWTWDPIAKAYFWHRFYSHQPDLNYENPIVQQAVFDIVDFWLEMGVDGLRLDAITYLYQQEGTNCESLPQTHEFLKKLRHHIDTHFSDRMLLAEANQWPEEAIDYFGNGDECQMAFHFPLMPRLFMALFMEDRNPLVDIIEQTPPLPEGAQWAVFLRNHDELTLEMVTDEERDLMYRAFAPEVSMRINLGIRRRLAPLLQNDRRKIELMYGLLFSIGGTPIIYYGDEIGMGDNYFLGDRDGVRTPMQWNSNMNAGFSQANPQMLDLPTIIDPEYHYISVNVYNQENNPASLLNWMKKLIRIRKRFPAFARGTLDFVNPDNHKTVAYLRHYEDQTILVVVNLSASAQFIELDLQNFAGRWPIELLGYSQFPKISADETYKLTLAPHSFLWFLLQKQPLISHIRPDDEILSAIEIRGDWTVVLSGHRRGQLEQFLMHHLPRQSWFRKERVIESIVIEEYIQLRSEDDKIIMLFVLARYFSGDSDIYVVALAYATGKRERDIRRDNPEAVIAPIWVETLDTHGILYDAFVNKSFARSLLNMVLRGWSIRGQEGALRGEQLSLFEELISEEEALLTPETCNISRSHTTVTFDQELVLKSLRRLEKGLSLDIEVGSFLLEQGFSHCAKIVGHLTYIQGRNEPMTVGVLTQYIPNQGDAWTVALRAVDEFLMWFDKYPTEIPEIALHTASLLELDREHVPKPLRLAIFPFLDMAFRLGERTAQLHQTLASAPQDTAFAPEPYSNADERSRYQAMRTLTTRVFRLIKSRFDKIPKIARDNARYLLHRREDVLDHFRAIVGKGIGGMRIRIHGDFYLEEVLVTENDFAIIDFEGHPWLPIGERRIKRAPLRDVASMTRSLHTVAFTRLYDPDETSDLSSPPDENRHQAAQFWAAHVCAQYMKGYLNIAQNEPFIPEQFENIITLLDALRLEKLLMQIEYEIYHDINRIIIPLQAVASLLQKRAC